MFEKFEEHLCLGKTVKLAKKMIKICMDDPSRKLHIYKTFN